jgi:uncharacterized protein involved in propanediol utilization
MPSGASSFLVLPWQWLAEVTRFERTQKRKTPSEIPKLVFETFVNHTSYLTKKHIHEN